MPPDDLLTILVAACPNGAGHMTFSWPAILRSTQRKLADDTHPYQTRAKRDDVSWYWPCTKKPTEEHWSIAKEGFLKLSRLTFWFTSGCSVWRWGAKRKCRGLISRGGCVTHLRIAVPRSEIPLKTVCKQGNATSGHVSHAWSGFLSRKLGFCPCHVPLCSTTLAKQLQCTEGCFLCCHSLNPTERPVWWSSDKSVDLVHRSKRSEAPLFWVVRNRKSWYVESGWYVSTSKLDGGTSVVVSRGRAYHLHVTGQPPSHGLSLLSYGLNVTCCIRVPWFIACPVVYSVTRGL